jgi:hypothetical protein
MKNPKLITNNQQNTATQATATTFELKQRRRFILKFDGIDSFLVKKVDLPNFSVGSKAVNASEHVIVHMHCPVNPSAEKQVFNTVTKQLEKGHLEDARIVFLDPVGTIVTEYIFTEPTIITFKISDLDYASTEPVEMVLKFSYKSLVIPD